MNKFLRNAFFLGLCLFFTAQAHAELIWAWSFDTPNPGTVGAFDHVYGRAKITNSADSDSTLELHYAGFYNVMRAGQPVWEYKVNLGHLDPFPWNDFSHDMQVLSIAPGETGFLNFGHFFAPDGAALGEYSILGVLGTGTDAGQYTFDTLRWTVGAAVPEPESLALVLLGLGLIGAGKMQSRKSAFRRAALSC